MKYYRIFSLLAAITFAVVGMLFLLIPGQVIGFFNHLSEFVGMRPAPVQDVDFYHILAVGYMYLVTLLAFFMFRFPDNPVFPLLLTHAKIASSLLSLSLFVVHQPYLIYITNCIVDGGIGIAAFLFYHMVRRETR